MELAVTVLLISALTTTGLLALAAANWRGNWFGRTAAFLAMLAPLLAVPAPELFITLAVQGLLVAATLAAVRCRSARRSSRLNEDSGSPNDPPRRQVSLAMLLRATALCGVAAAVASRTPALNAYAWWSLALIAFVGATACLLGYWAAMQSSWTGRFCAALVGLLTSVVAAGAPAWFDGFVPSLAPLGGNWPPEWPDVNSPTWILEVERPVTQWFLIAPGIVLATLAIGLISVLMPVLASTAAAWSARTIRWLGVGLRVVCVGVVAAPSLAVLWKLLTPEPPPTVVLPVPNAYDDYVAAGQSIANAMINSGAFDDRTATEPVLRKAVAEAAAAIARTRSGLQKQYLSPVDFAPGDNNLPLDYIQSVRSLARALSAAGRPSELGEILTALWQPTSIRFASAATVGGADCFSRGLWA